MGAGLPDFVVVNLSDLEKIFEAGSEVTLEAVSEKVLSVSGRDADLPLKVRWAGSGTLHGVWQKHHCLVESPTWFNLLETRRTQCL